MRGMSLDWASLWRAVSTSARGPRSRKSTGVQTGNGFRARIRSSMRVFRSRAGPRCVLVCLIFAYIFRTISVQTMLTLFGQIQQGRSNSPQDKHGFLDFRRYRQFVSPSATSAGRNVAMYLANAGAGSVVIRNRAAVVAFLRRPRVRREVGSDRT